MTSVIEILSWDMITTRSGDLVVIIPPIPQPRGILLARDAVYILTQGLPVRLVASVSVMAVVERSRTVVLGEAHEHIVRETLVPVARINLNLNGESLDELAAA